MPNVISVSRRTDIPAFYGDWFMKRVSEGEAGCINPFGGSRHTISLRPEDVIAFVFWSKNAAPFIKHLDELDSRGYKFYFNLTINNYTGMFERNVPPWRESVKTARFIAERYSPDHINWRFDPIVLSSVTPPETILKTFKEISAAMSGATHRCYFSFVQYYGKVIRNMLEIGKSRNIVFRAGKEAEEKFMEKHNRLNDFFAFDLTAEEKTDLTRKMADIAADCGISMHTCCDDSLLASLNDSRIEIFKGHCIDKELLCRLTVDKATAIKLKPTRPECGCFESRDIGAYDTCPHGCEYCYANSNVKAATVAFQRISQRSESFSLHTSIPSHEFP